MLFAQDRQTLQTPVSNEVNSQLPQWLKFSGEERARMEYIVGSGFKAVDDLYLLNRLRLNMVLPPFRYRFGGMPVLRARRCLGEMVLSQTIAQRHAARHSLPHSSSQRR